MTWKELPEVIKQKMLKIQKEQQGRAKASVFEHKITACKTEGGIDWPLEHFELWSDALKEGKIGRLEKSLTKRPYAKKMKAVEKPAKPSWNYSTPHTREKGTVVYFKEPTENLSTAHEVLETFEGTIVDNLDKFKKVAPGLSAGDFAVVREGKVKEEVNHPDHYNVTSTEVIVMMEAIWGKAAVKLFCEMNAFKYRMRAGYKGDAVKDIEKALWYEGRAKL